MNATNFLKTPRALSQGASLFAVVSALAVFAGCATEPESHVVSAPPPAAPPGMNATVVPQTVVTAPGTTATAIPGTNAVVITQAPPATPAQEAVVAQPSPRHVWIEGYWTWQSNRYVWVAGHWEVPPRSGAVWVPPVTQRQANSNSYTFQEGYWK